MRRTALGELLGTDFPTLSEAALYRNMDRLHPKRALIESDLVERERERFNLDQTIFFYDLTSTYFEGQALANPKAKQCRRQRIPENAVKLLYRLDRWVERMRFVGKPVAEEEQSCSGEIGFGLDLFAAILGQCMFVVPEHRILVPRNEAVTDLMRFVPAMLLLRQVPVKEDPFSIRKVERLK